MAQLRHLELYRWTSPPGIAGPGNYKVCRFCGARVQGGIIVRRNEMIRAFVCLPCSDLLAQVLRSSSGRLTIKQE
jgi:hypothetical protein